MWKMHKLHVIIPFFKQFHQNQLIADMHVDIYGSETIVGSHWVIIPYLIGAVGRGEHIS
jgi:hypothetical protein